MTLLSRIFLQDNSVHVWLAHADRLPSDSRLTAALTTSEHTRAESHRFQQDRTRFLRRREFLRGILARYTDVTPDRLRFDQNMYGKPFLQGLDVSEPLSFSTSHSAGLAVVCVARSPFLGIDIEKQAGTALLPDEAPIVLAPAEIDALKERADTAPPDALLRFWTCKEALVKAIGMGLSLPLNEIEITDIEADCPRVRRIANEYGPPAQWHLRRFAPASGYVGAIAVKAPATMQVHTWTWNADDHLLACG